ncbi:MAG TPA: 4Fe-4S double cluster binding domain-containing protein [Smithella sp.]|nr:epoxyqueuosine reductase [Smithella sp.]MDM7986305.1 4Fe-4S double cluster binding domain-containing protein [Smithella sp.]HNY49554.1 4Fe-4S double cluster binding domain-containing protein [Smithella sp.]HOG89327.1 4Fe-4S double cluster binding domain-containing protein [Smithella sp.]HOU50139.1 4Fe-4S double cluster binding domain-containing protein [Smithella sp.]
MLTKQDIIDEATRLQFADIGFTTVEPFASQRDYLAKSQEAYGWAEAVGLGLIAGTDPRNILAGAKSIIVVLESYFEKSFPPHMERHFGRCYLDDDRVTKDGLALKIKALRNFLRDHGIDSKVPFNLPHRLSAARAGLGTFGKNCLFYARRVAGQSSFVFPIALVIDHEFPEDEPTIAIGCPDWCRNACVAACPTRALKGDGKIDPRRCISFLTYYGEGLTPPELREPMGLNVYGCDRCQNVCPRNVPWLTTDKQQNPRVLNKAADFRLSRLLHMDQNYFLQKIWPHMFYMSADDLWRWKMNVARAMGNSRHPDHVADLVRAFGENSDERVRCMIAWALGRIGTREATVALKNFYAVADGIVKDEITQAMISTGEKR